MGSANWDFDKPFFYSPCSTKLTQTNLQKNFPENCLLGEEYV